MSPPGARAQMLYGALFVVALPALPVAWARFTRGIVHLPVPFAPALGLSLSVAGFALLALGMLALRLHGQGWRSWWRARRRCCGPLVSMAA